MKKLLFILAILLTSTIWSKGQIFNTAQTKPTVTTPLQGSDPISNYLDKTDTVLWAKLGRFGDYKLWSAKKIRHVLDSLANAKQDTLTLTTDGTGAATLIGSTLNIPISSGIVPDSLKEDKANKENTTVDNSTTKYPTVNLLKTYADTKLPITNINGTIGYIPKFTGTNSIGNSPIYTDGTNTKITSNQNSHPDLNLIGAGTNQGWLGISDGNNYGIQGGPDYEGMNFLVSGVNALRIRYTGQIGMGYSTDSPELINNKLAVNGSGYFNGTVNSTGYLLNGSNLFSSLTSGKITKWDGTKLTPIVDGTNGQVLGTDGNGNYSFVNQSGGTETITVQSLSGTSPTFDTSLGVNAVLTMSGNTTLTFSNVNVGSSGWINITNAATLYTLDLTGYNFKITQNIYGNTGYRVGLSGGSKLDRIGWSYDGSVVVISGSLSLKP